MTTIDPKPIVATPTAHFGCLKCGNIRQLPWSEGQSMPWCIHLSGEYSWRAPHPESDWTEMVLVTVTVTEAHRTWTPEEIIAAFRQWADDHDGAPPSIGDWDGGGSSHPAPITVRRHFGTWAAAVHAAGLSPRGRGRPRTTEHTGEDLPRTRRDTTAPWPCPRCGAPAGERCVHPGGSTRGPGLGMHDDRWRARPR